MEQTTNLVKLLQDHDKKKHKANIVILEKGGLKGSRPKGLFKASYVKTYPGCDLSIVKDLHLYEGPYNQSEFVEKSVS